MFPRCVPTAPTLAGIIFLWAPGLAYELVKLQDAEPAVYTGPRGNVAHLNRVNFEGNVLAEDKSIVDRWFVFYCVEWHAPCADIRRAYVALAARHEGALNDGRLLSASVRFAEVSCAIDKVLCKQQHVDSYPTVAHYIAGRQRAYWAGAGAQSDVPRLARWVQKELRRPPGRAEQDGVPLGRALRLAASTLAAVAAGVTVLFNVGLEAWRAVSKLRRQQAGETGPVKAARRPGGAGETQEPSTRLQHVLQDAWGRQRSSLAI